VATIVVFETHALSEDNERGVASGWAHSRLSGRGRRQAEELGERRRRDGIAAVFSSDLGRECNYGDLTGGVADAHTRDRVRYLDEPYPSGESWRQAAARVARWLDDLTLGWRGERVLVVGHVATRWALDHYLNGVPLETLVAADFAWQQGWEYQVLN
jgi:2,3-bisphosphoglycerate-dependent phosphoglycerate mutase